MSQNQTDHVSLRCFKLGICLLFIWADVILADEAPPILPGTALLSVEKPLDVLMVDGIDRFCLREIELFRERRELCWNRDFRTFESYEKSLSQYRERFCKLIGVVDQRIHRDRLDRPIIKDWQASRDFRRTNQGQLFSIQEFQWVTLPGMTAEGLLLIPEKPDWKGMVIAVPDSRWSPDQYAGVVAGDIAPISSLPRRFAENGFLVVIPTLINREDEFSGNPEIAMTNQSHREWVYRSAFEMGRHVIGYEVQKILAIVDRLTELNLDSHRDLLIGIAGVGDGGQIALYGAALDNRIKSVLVSGYFQMREKVWQEPIDRNVWRLLTEFGDAEIAGMIAPRSLIIEACAVPETDGPLPIKPGRRGGAAPGCIRTADLSSVQTEFRRAKSIYHQLDVEDHLQLVISGVDGRGESTSEAALRAFTDGAGLSPLNMFSGNDCVPLKESVDRAAIQKRQVQEAVEFSQTLLRNSYKIRDKLFAQSDRVSVEKWLESAEKLRDHVHQELIGKLSEPQMPPHPRTRKILDEKEFTGYEVVLDTYPDVIAAGILLIPKGMVPDEKRPVVVCQHGLEGTPMDTIAGPGSEGFKYYKSFASQLAKLGFITYSPQNPYRGQDRFRSLQRKSNILGRSLFSYIIPQHQVTLKWLASLPNVDGERIAFYGLSYGGKTAMRVPPILTSTSDHPGYRLSICSGDFNEWVSKNASTDAPFTYVFTPEYEIFEWNMGHVANYAELAMLMTPRPFMVERGHQDAVGIDEWVAWEYAKVRRHYDQLGLADKTEIEFFNGPHTINGKGTFEFLQRHLNWPKR